jgi:hypothetical protein
VGGKPVNAFSPYWRSLRLSKWVSDEGTVTAEGDAAAHKYMTVRLTCCFCDRQVAEYVAALGVTKTLFRKCPCCDFPQKFVVASHGELEVFGSRP